MINSISQGYLGIFLSLILFILQLLHVAASGSGSESASGDPAEFLPASFVNYGNYSEAQCFSLDENGQVDCLMQMLNTTDPPSIYNYWDYNALWEPVSCLLRNVTLGDRADDDATFNYCTVPLRGYDAFLFVSIALLATCMLFGKLSAVFVLIVGGILGVINYYANLLQISNSISLWLSIQPADLFFYAFLPPLLVDQAIRIDFFMFRKIWVHALFMAFVMVVLSAIALSPFILFVLGFQSRGWSWVHGGLLAAIISPTDALAVASILAKANGPERVVAVMEGECLFNDASAITLFEVFAHLIYEHLSELPPVWPSVWSVIPTILLDIVRLSVIGVAIGLAMSWVTWHLLRWLRWRGARPYIETTVVLAVAYLSYYVTNSPAKGSGVIAVVVFGLYGNATSKWGMLASAEESGAFDAVWDMISFSANGLVFFWSGVASVNFFVRSADLLPRTGWSYGAIPLIYIFMVFIRCFCVALFNPVFSALGEGLSRSEIFFIGFAGLRGSVSLIMVSAFATGTRLSLANADEAALVNADISLWASAFVVLTLVINGPMIAPVLRWLKLNTVPKEKMKMRARAKRALCRFTDQQMAELRDDDDEFLQGANWDAVAQYVDLSGPIDGFDCASDAKSKSSSKSKKHPTSFGAKLKAPFTKSYAWFGNTFLWPNKEDNLKVAGVSTPSKKELKPLDSDAGATARAKTKKLKRKKSVGFENGSQPVTAAMGTPSSSSADGGSSSTASPNGVNGQPFGADSPHTSSLETPRDGNSSERELLVQHLQRQQQQQQQQQQMQRAGTGGGHHHIYDPWAQITAEELAQEMHDECPFFTTTEEQEAHDAAQLGGATTSSSDGLDRDIELGIMDNAASSSSYSDAAIAAALAASSSENTKTANVPSTAAAGAAEVAAAAGASPPSASREGSTHRNASINLASITEGKPMEEDDQMCLTGAAGAKLLNELRRTMSKGEQTLPPDYYASLPAGAGAKLKQQLARELESLAGPNLTAASPGGAGGSDLGADDGMDAGGVGADYYCSLPALAGKKLQEELRQATAAAVVTSSEPQQELQQQQSVQSDEARGASASGENPDYYTSMPAAVGRNMLQKLQRQLAAEQAAVQIAANLGAPPTAPTPSPAASAPGALPSAILNKTPSIPSPFVSGTPADPPRASSLPVDSTTSLPAATGKAMQAELQRRLQVRVPTHSRRSSIDGASPRVSSPRISGGRPDMEYYSYHATVSGVSGSNLATELKERIRTGGVLSQRGSERDLLGRKVVPKKQLSELSSLPPIPPFSASKQQQEQQQQQQPRPAFGGTSSSVAAGAASRFRAMTMSTDRTMAATAPISMALLDKKKSNLHAFRRSATSLTRRQPERAVSTISSEILDDATNLSGSGGDASLPSSSSLMRRAGAGVDAPTAPIGNDPSAMLLARTFSVGASLHRRGRPSGSVSMGRTSVEEDEDEETSTTTSSAAGDGAGDAFQNRSTRLMMDQRTISATTLREGSFDKEPGILGEEAQREAEDTDMLAEMRVRLLAGLKRHYVAKRLAGLLSVEGLRILQYACDVASDKASEPLQVWASLEKEVSGSWTTRVASRLSLWTTRGYRAMHPFFQKTLSWPFTKFAGLLRRFLGRKMLVACEVAVEYYLSLLWSPQIQWLKGHGESCWRLLDEVEAENEAAHHFLIEREIEAPDRFQAIQSYRAAMAVLRQQMLFVGELFETGMINESEQHGLHDPIDRKMRHLELVGPVWRPPRPKAVLRSLPFMAALPDSAFRKVYDTGSFIEFRRGQCIWTATDLVRRTGGAQGPGGFVVLSGVVKRVHIRPDGGRKEYFQGSGGIIGVLLSITGTKLPGTELAIAEGNALGKGPVVFHIPQQVAQGIQIAAANGDLNMIGLEEELARLSAAYVVESLDVELVVAVSLHLEKILGLPPAVISAIDDVANQQQQQQQQQQGNQPLERAGSSKRISSNDPGASDSNLYRSPSGIIRGAQQGQQQQTSSGQQQQQVPRRATSDASALHAELGGGGGRERRTTAVSQPPILPLGAAGLTTSKSVGANLAAMMQQIAALEYEEDEDDEETDSEEYAAMDRVNSTKDYKDGGDVRKSQQRSSFHGRRSFEEISKEDFDGVKVSDPELGIAMDKRPASPSKRGVRFSTAMHTYPDAEHRFLLTAALHRAPQLAADVSLDIRRSLHSSFVMKLDPGSYFVQTSHVVLIAGSLDLLKETLNASIPALDDGGAIDNEKAVSAPAVLPWLWQDRWVSGVGSNVSLIEVIEWQVGWQGAHVAVAHNADGTVPDCVLDHEERMEEKERAQKAAKLSSFPLSSTSPGAADNSNSTGKEGMKRVPSHSGSESGSLRGTAAAAMKDTLIGLLRRSVTEPVKSPP